MIQTKTAFFYEDRGDKLAKIKVEIESYSTDKNGVNYIVNDWAVQEDGTKTLYKTKTVRYSNETINNLDSYISASNDFEGMSKTDREWKKMQIALMLDTQTNLLSNGTTIYRLQPTDWEFSE
jgi:uncharacterized protein YutD